VRSLTWDQVDARRLEASWLTSRAPADDLLDVVRATCGVHAQLMTGAELALSARVEGVTRTGVRERLWERRELVKGNTLRGTLHLHPADEFALWKSIRGVRDRWREPSWLDWQGLTLAEAESLRADVLVVLDDGEPRTREQIGVAVGGRLGEHIATDSWGHFLSPASGDLCQGPPRGRNVTFVRCDRWIAGWALPAPEAALREVCRRFLATYGPAQRGELEHWLALRLPDEAFEGLEEVDVEGRRAWAVPGTTFPNASPSGVRLLSHYDVYVIGAHPRDHLIPQQKERIFLRGAGPNPALLADGIVAGVWARKDRGKRVEIRVEPFRRLTRAERQELAVDAERVASTYGAEADLQLVEKL
jgi:winged helix DNA-binding protein